MKVQRQVVKAPPCGVIDTFPFVVSFNKTEASIIKHRQKDIIVWGNETFGRFCQHWGMSIPYGKTRHPKLYIHEEAHATLFALMWLRGSDNA